jgi:hypothetical protein
MLTTISLVKLALWQFSLSFDDPVTSTLISKALVPKLIMDTLRRKRCDTTGYAGKSPAQIATLFLERELERRETVQDGDNGG